MEQVLRANDWPVRLGRWWFQWRGFSPLPLFLLCLVLPAPRVLSPLALSVVLAALVAAEALRVWAVGYAGSVTRTRGDGVSKLVHAGPFRYVRNPLYVANTAMYTLAGVAFGFTGLSLVIAVYSAVQYHFIVAFEEKMLRREHGDAYGFYCARVPRWLPLLSPGVEPSFHVFDLKKALRSERATLLALGFLLVLLFWKRSLA